MKQQNQSWPVAFCGVSVALAVVVMLLGAVIPAAMFIAPAVGGLLIAAVEAECGRSYAFTAYGAASLLSLLFVPDKECALFFVVLLGYYPLVKPRFDRLRPALLRAGAKLCLCDGSTLAMYALALLFFPGGEIAAELRETALVLAAVTLMMGDVAFLLYDKALADLLRVYRLLWQPKLHRMLGRR